MSADANALGILTVDVRDADGRPGRPFQLKERPMAIHDASGVWYGFYVVRSDEPIIGVGRSARVELCFLNEEESPEKFSLGTPIRFGDGVITRGTLVIEHWIPTQERRPVIPDALVTLTVDKMNSGGQPGIPVTSRLRPMVRRVDATSWYSFVLIDEALTIGVGDTATVAVAFVNPTDARTDFPEGTKTVFGNGPSVFGSFVLERWFEAD